MVITKAAIGSCAIYCMAISMAMADARNDEAFASADAAAQSGRLDDMQSAYEDVLQRAPENVRALTGKATAMAWQGNYTGAQKNFERALALDSQNIDALIGLGYAYSWDRQFSNAHTQFQRALRVDPSNVSARKGIAYSFYWQNENELALGAFQAVASMEPNSAELEEAIGRVNYSLGHKRDAVSNFEKALALDPQRESAMLAKRAAYTSAPVLQLSSSFGVTSDAGSGLRRLEAAHWASESTRFAVRYDNSLGLDNESISNFGEDAPAYFASVSSTFRERFTLGVEVGSRDLPGSRQTIVELQGTYFAPVGALRLGARQGRTRGGNVDNLLFGGINFPLLDRWRVEPMVYLSQTGAADDQEWRAVVSADYSTHSVWQLGGFVGAGKIDAADSLFSGNTTSAGVRGSYLWADKYSFHWGVRREDAPTAKFTVAEIGFTYRLIAN